MIKTEVPAVRDGLCKFGSVDNLPPVQFQVCIANVLELANQNLAIRSLVWCGAQCHTVERAVRA